MDEDSLRKLWRFQLTNVGPIQGWDEWKQLIPGAWAALITRAREEPYDFLTISYSELGGVISLKVVSDWFPLKIAVILGACSRYEYWKGRPLISAIVVNKDSGKPGRGFCTLEGIPEDLRKSGRPDDISPETLTREQEKFWIEELRRIDKYWKETPIEIIS